MYNIYHFIMYKRKYSDIDYSVQSTSKISFNSDTNKISGCALLKTIDLANNPLLDSKYI